MHPDFTIMIQITANGESFSLQASTRIPAFLDSIELPLDKVVVEHNGQALTRAEAREVELQDGDQLEVVRIVAGG